MPYAQPPMPRRLLQRFATRSGWVASIPLSRTPTTTPRDPRVVFHALSARIPPGWASISVRSDGSEGSLGLKDPEIR